MLRLAITVALLLAVSATLAPGQSSPGAPVRNPLVFLESGGRIGGDTSHLLHAADRTLFFTPRGVTFSLFDPRGERDDGWAYRLEFVGARHAAPEVEASTTTRYSYFRGDRSNWRTGLRAYRRLRYRDVWPDIDVVFHTANGRLEYDVVVRPGGDPSEAAFRYVGVDVALRDDGRLAVNAGGRRFEDSAPITYQQVDGRKQPVPSRYRVHTAEPDTFEFGFDVGDYDAALPLVVDPILPVYCGYIGGVNDDDAFGCAVDASGCLYVMGRTFSGPTSFPATTGPLLNLRGSSDVHVAKVAADGKSLVYCGYIGGSAHDTGYGLALDAQGRAYVVGYTRSGDFPVVQGPYLRFNGQDDGFVVRVNAAGTSLDYSGFIGGTANDFASSVAVDATGRAYVCGATKSSEASFPVKVGPVLRHRGDYDSYIACVAPDGRQFEWCGYVGGAQRDQAWGIGLTTGGAAVIVGATTSSESTFPVRLGPDLTYNGGRDAFVAIVANGGGTILGCGYIGGGDLDDARAVAVDRNDDIYLTGFTRSLRDDRFPVRVGPRFLPGGPKRRSMDGFVAKVSGGSGQLVYCGYIGSEGTETGNTIAVNARGEAYVGGYASGSRAFPLIVGPVYPNAAPSGFVARVAADGSRFHSIGRFGGNGYDDVRGIALDATENVYITGYTRSTTPSFPAVVGPDLTFNGGQIGDAFVAKLEQVVLDVNGTPRPGRIVALDMIASGDAGRAYQVATALNTGRIAIGSRTIGLAPDPLFVATISGTLGQVFRNYSGTIGSAGRASASIRIPPSTALIGVDFHSAFVTFDTAAPFGVQSVSNVRSFRVIR